MNSTLLEAVFNNVLQLLPCRIVHSFERGVLFHMGTDVRALEPGLHWFIPFVQSIEVVNVAPETRNLVTQTVTTKDGHSVTFSANVCYRIVDARVMYTAVQDFDGSMEAYAMVHLARAISRLTLAQLKRNRAQIERQFARALSRRVKAWGARIEYVGLTDLTEARAFRLFGDPSPFRGSL